MSKGGGLERASEEGRDGKRVERENGERKRKGQREGQLDYDRDGQKVRREGGGREEGESGEGREGKGV